MSINNQIACGIRDARYFLFKIPKGKYARVAWAFVYCCWLFLFIALVLAVGFGNR